MYTRVNVQLILSTFSCINGGTIFQHNEVLKMKHKKHAKQVLELFLLLIIGPFKKIRAHALKVNAKYDGPPKKSARWDEIVAHVKRVTGKPHDKKGH